MLKNKDLLISIITVVYNAKNLLEKTIKSVFSQSYINIEYIIIDGASSDGTVDIIKKYENKISYWVSEEDNGIYDAMNKGIKMAKGDGLIFMNAGDYFVGDMLTNNVDLTIPLFLPIKYENYFKKFGLLKLKSYKQGIPYCHQGIIFENNDILYNTNYKIAADYDYYLNHGYTNNINFLDTKAYIHYDNYGFSKKYAKLRDIEILTIIENNFAYFYVLNFKLKSIIKNIIKALWK